MKTLITWFRERFSDPQVVVLCGFLVLGAVLIFLIGDILAPVFAALVIAYLLEGLVSWMEKQRMPRLLAVCLVFSVFMLAALVALFGLLPLLYRQIAHLVQQLPAIILRAKQELMQLPERYPEIISAPQITQVLNAVQSEVGRFGQNLLSFSLASVRGLVAFLVYLILVPLMVFFMLKDKGRIVAWFTYFRPSDHKLSSTVWHDVDAQIGNYVRGKFIEILIVWAVAASAFALIGLQAAMLFGFFVGISVLVPYVGVTVMFLPVALMAYFQWGLAPGFLHTVTAYAVIQLLDGNLLAPLLLSEVVNLHPLAIIVAVLLCGGLWGFWGVFFAIPLATMVQAVIRAWPAKPGAPPMAATPPAGDSA